MRRGTRARRGVDRRLVTPAQSCALHRAIVGVRVPRAHAGRVKMQGRDRARRGESVALRGQCIDTAHGERQVDLLFVITRADHALYQIPILGRRGVFRATTDARHAQP